MKLHLPRFTLAKGLFGLILLAGFYSAVLRFTRGLGASTNLSDAYPWGLWVGFDVLCGVMLAAGGFTLTTVVHVFNIERFKPIIRPTVLTAFLGYALVVVALLFDLGRSFRIWHAVVMWNPRSVMFEVAWCVMLYTTVLALEFAPVVFERLHWARAAQVLRGLGVPLVIAGALLSTLHQSSLGSLYLIMPQKLDLLWYSPMLPVLFFVSAIAIGLAMTIVESSLSARYFRKQLELPLLMELGRILVVVLAVYGVLRFQDLWHRGVLPLLVQPRRETYFFLLEIALSLVLPIGLLLNAKIRRRPGGLFLSAALVVAGFILNRLNVSLVGMATSAGGRYLPKWTEVAITLSIFATGIAIFGLAAKYLPIFPPQEKRGSPSADAPGLRPLARPGESPAT